MTTQPEASAAIKTLQSIGYTYQGGEFWKPPIGKAPNFDLIDSLHARIAELNAQQAVPRVVTEQMHVAAVKVLRRASGVDGLPQRMLDAMLAAAPTPPAQERKPLTDEQILQAIRTATNDEPARLPPGWMQFARAIEGAHGIGSPAIQQCWCTTCRPITLEDMRFVACPQCGNKRCPRAHNHELACSGSNEPGQKGSSWEHVQPGGRDGNQS